MSHFILHKFFVYGAINGRLFGIRITGGDNGENRMLLNPSNIWGSIFNKKISFCTFKLNCR